MECKAEKTHLFTDTAFPTWILYFLGIVYDIAGDFGAQKKAIK